MGVVGVKGFITSLNTNSNNLGSLNSNSKYESVNEKSIDSFTFTISSIEVKKTNFLAGTHNYPFSKGSLNLNDVAGYLQYGTSFSSLTSSSLDHPLAHSFPTYEEVKDNIQGKFNSPDGRTSKYWWKGNTIWHLKHLESQFGSSFSGVISDKGEIYVERFTLEFNSERDWFEFIFEGWEVVKPKKLAAKDKRK